MRTKLRSKVTLLFMTCALLIAIPAVAALADNVQNDVVAGGTDTITTAPGSSTTINYEIKNTSAGGGGFSGCDAADGSTLTLTINKPPAVTASPESLSFNACDVQKGVQFSSSTAGDYPITVTASDTHGNYNVNGAAFTLHVTNPPPPTNTAPTLTLPGNQTAEATSSAGAVVNYTATATDAQDDPDPTPECSPASGSTFPLGSTQVDCSVTDSGGLTTSGFFAVTVQDTTKPVIAAHGDVTAEATGPDGADVSYTSPATSDAVDGNGTATCLPASDTKFALGDTTVTCNATDAAGNQATPTTFKVTVEDTTEPVLTLPDDITKEATGPGGAAVTYSATASDLVDGNMGDADCTPASGATFPITTTTVNCSATDAAGNEATGSFTVKVQDTTGPVLTLPANITTTAPSNSAATVTYTASANDVVDGSRPVTCNPASGGSFPAGTTTVNCSAIDATGNTSNGSFTVTVNYNWSGFFQPIDNNVPNKAKAGSVVPVKFSLKGDQGLNIFAAGYPRVVSASGCAVSSADLVEEYAAANASGLKYDATADQYIYNWKTQSNYAGKCLQLEVKLADGSPAHTALFSFFK
jgi:hypothetical protein